MRRHHICLGDATSAGGVVASAGAGFSILGRPAAVEGDAVDCRACKSVGAIVLAGPRHADSLHGRALALEGDLCSCKCRQPPTLLAGQSLSYQSLDDPGGLAPGPSGVDPAPESMARP